MRADRFGPPCLSIRSRSDLLPLARVRRRGLLEDTAYTFCIKGGYSRIRVTMAARKNLVWDSGRRRSALRNYGVSAPGMIWPT